MLSESVESKSPSQVSRPWPHWSILLPLLLIYLALASYGLDHQSLWTDEILSVRDAASASTIWKKGQGPLYFALLHVWKNVTDADWGLRALSVMIGALAVCLFYATCTTLFNQRVTLFGTLLFATSPFVIWYSQEVRYIILMLATALLAMLTFRRLVNRGGLALWCTYGGATIIAYASFVTNIFLPLVQGLYLLWSPSRRRMLGKWLVCMVLVSIPFGIWAGNKLAKTVEVNSTTTGQQTVSINPKKLDRGPAARAFSPLMLPYTFFALSAGFSQGPSVFDLHQSQSFATVLPHMPILVSIGIPFIILSITGFIAIWHQPDVGKLLSLWMFVPLCSVFVMAFVVTNLGFNVRYTAMILPAYLMILASGIAWFRRLAVQLIFLAAILCSNGLSLANYYTDPYYAREDSRSAVQYLMEVYQAHDGILMVGSNIGFSYYSKGSLPFEQLDLRKSKDLDVKAALQRIVQDYHRLWVVEIRPWARDPKGKIKAALDDMYDRTGQKDFPGVVIRSYHIAP
jgi:hypothetical protein